MPKIISIAPSGNWNGMYKFQVVLDNGQSGTAYSKQPTLRFALGDEVVATLNDKGSLKLEAPGYAAGAQQGYPQNNGYTNQAAPAGMSKDELIVRQVALKAGVELGAAQGLDLNQILQHANVFNDWIMRKEAAGRTHQEHFTQDEDPFLS